jgi:hypothetical protein
MDVAVQSPVVSIHDGIHVVRDDLFPGGTKARFIGELYSDCEEVVYATPCEGGAQTALATVAARLGKRATLFCAARKNPHPRVAMAQRLGATYHFVAPGYLSVVQARAEDYADRAGAKLAQFGIPDAVDAIADAALATGLTPDEVWCASGSGTLARGLAKAWPWARRYAVQVGRELTFADVDNAIIVKQPLAFGKPHLGAVPFPADPHYDAKAWKECKARHRGGLVLFWNVTGPATP